MTNGIARDEGGVPLSDLPDTEIKRVCAMSKRDCAGDDIDEHIQFIRPVGMKNAFVDIGDDVFGIDQEVVTIPADIK